MTHAAIDLNEKRVAAALDELETLYRWLNDEAEATLTNVSRKRRDVLRSAIDYLNGDLDDDIEERVSSAED